MKTKLWMYLPFLMTSLLFSMERLPKDQHLIVAKSTEESTAWKLDLLKNAERRIYMMSGYAEGDILGKILTIFEESLAQKPELKIWLFVSTFPALDIDKETKRVKKIEEDYPERFHLLIKGATSNYEQAEGTFNTENHAKLLIVDEKYTILGGTNLVDSLSRSNIEENRPSISATFMPKAALDQDILLFGPSPDSLIEDFFRVWGVFAENIPLENSLGAFYPKLNGPEALLDEEKSIIPLFENHPERIYPVRTKTILAGPRVNPHAIQYEYITLIEKASSEIQLGQLYFFPIDAIFNPLMEAANRGIAIHAMTNGFWKEVTLKESSLWFFVQRSRVHYFPLLMGRKFSLTESVEARTLPQRNVQMYELNENYMMYHKKVMTVDGLCGIVGSFNFGQKSAFSDYEVVAVIESKEAISQINAILRDDMKRGTKINRDVAYGWYYNPYYYIAGDLQGKMIDGLMLSMKKITVPPYVEPQPGQMENFLITGIEDRPKQ